MGGAARKIKFVWNEPVDEQGRPIVDAYLRMSDGFGGKEDNRQNMIEDIMPIYEQNNWALGEVLQDEVSAWKLGVRRDDFETLLERIDTGLSAGVVFYNQDRLVRRPMDLERFLLLWEEGRDLKVASMYGAINLNDGQARAFMRQMATQAMAASDDTSRRARRKNKGRRDRGLITNGGGRAFAWPGKGVDPELVKREREALQWAFEKIAAGGTQAEVARKWNSEGLLTCHGNEWNAITVRNTMKRQRYAGRIEYHGEVVGNIADHKPTIDPELFDRVHGIFTGRAYGRPVGKTSLGSGIICCSKCLKPMVSRPRYRYRGGEKVTIPTYICVKGRGGCGGTVIDQAPIDEMLRVSVIARLSDPEIADKVSSIKAGQNAEIDRVRAQLETARTTERGLAAKHTAGRISWQVFSDMQDVAFDRIKRLGEELKALEAAAADLGAVRTQSELAVATEWDENLAAGDIAALRIMIKTALRGLERPVILPGKPRGKGAHIPPGQRFEIVPLRSGIGNTTRRVGFVAATSG